MSPLIAEYVRLWKEALVSDAEFCAKLDLLSSQNVGVTDAAREEARAWISLDWIVRECAPAWLDLATVIGARTLSTMQELSSESVAQTSRDIDAVLAMLLTVTPPPGIVATDRDTAVAMRCATVSSKMVGWHLSSAAGLRNAQMGTAWHTARDAAQLILSRATWIASRRATPEEFRKALPGISSSVLTLIDKLLETNA
jgi:hypothetical protein